ncbi:phosphatidylinositol-3,5-bisphosphate 5-phosphatase [Rhodotorula toruloides]
MESGQTGEEKEPGITELDGETSSVRSVVVEEEEAASSRIRMPDKHVVLEKMALYQTQAYLYLIASDKDEQRFRILKIDREFFKKAAARRAAGQAVDDSEMDLDIQEDGIVYSFAEKEDLLDTLKAWPSNNFKDLKQPCFGIAGFVRFSCTIWMVVITARSKVGLLGGHFVFHSEGTELVEICRDKEAAAASIAEDQRHKNAFTSVYLSRNFYFSHTYDISNTLQNNLLRGSSTLPRRDKWVWNWHLLRPLRNSLPADSPWIVPLIHGYYTQAKLTVFHRQVYIILIARRSRHFAGARFLRRGVNSDGFVANEVETEQIVCEPLTTPFYSAAPFSHDHPNLAPSLPLPPHFPTTHQSRRLSPRYTSHVQIRGSIPLYWTQDATKAIKPPIELALRDPFYTAAAKHFDGLFELYGGFCMALNLIKQHDDRESLLVPEFRSCIDYLNQFLPDEHRIDYTAFDMSAAKAAASAAAGPGESESDAPRKSVTDYIEDFAETSLEKTGFFHSGEGGGRVTPIVQHGVVRTNCIDCLDRTNAAQTIIGKTVLGHQLHALGIIGTPCLPAHSDAIRQLEAMYLEHGDTIAVQYGGSNTVNTIDSFRPSELAWPAWSGGYSRDKVENMKRYYANSFGDYDKQAAIDLFLGIKPPLAPPAMWEYIPPPPRPSYRDWYSPSHLSNPHASPTDIAAGLQATIDEEDAQDPLDLWRRFYRGVHFESLAPQFAFKMISTLKGPVMIRQDDITVQASPLVPKMPRTYSRRPTTTSLRGLLGSGVKSRRHMRNESSAPEAAQSAGDGDSASVSQKSTQTTTLPTAPFAASTGQLAAALLKPVTRPDEAKEYDAWLSQFRHLSLAAQDHLSEKDRTMYEAHVGAVAGRRGTGGGVVGRPHDVSEKDRAIFAAFAASGQARGASALVSAEAASTPPVPLSSTASSPVSSMDGFLDPSLGGTLAFLDSSAQLHPPADAGSLGVSGQPLSAFEYDTWLDPSVAEAYEHQAGLSVSQGGSSASSALLDARQEALAPPAQPFGVLDSEAGRSLSRHGSGTVSPLEAPPGHAHNASEALQLAYAAAEYTNGIFHPGPPHSSAHDRQHAYARTPAPLQASPRSNAAPDPSSYSIAAYGQESPARRAPSPRKAAAAANTPQRRQLRSPARFDAINEDASRRGQLLTASGSRGNGQAVLGGAQTPRTPQADESVPEAALHLLRLAQPDGSAGSVATNSTGRADDDVSNEDDAEGESDDTSINSTDVHHKPLQQLFVEGNGVVAGPGQLETRVWHHNPDQPPLHVQRAAGPGSHRLSTTSSVTSTRGRQHIPARSQREASIASTRSRASEAGSSTTPAPPPVASSSSSTRRSTRARKPRVSASVADVMSDDAESEGEYKEEDDDDADASDGGRSKRKGKGAAGKAKKATKRQSTAGPGGTPAKKARTSTGSNGSPALPAPPRKARRQAFIPPNLRNRTFPPHVEINSNFPRFYRAFPVPSAFAPDSYILKAPTPSRTQLALQNAAMNHAAQAPPLPTPPMGMYDDGAFAHQYYAAPHTPVASTSTASLSSISVDPNAQFHLYHLPPGFGHSQPQAYSPPSTSHSHHPAQLSPQLSTASSSVSVTPFSPSQQSTPPSTAASTASSSAVATPAVYAGPPTIPGPNGVLIMQPPPEAKWNKPSDPLNLYWPRFVCGNADDKCGMCPICAEPKERGGEGEIKWLKLKNSSFVYHMSYAHGLSNLTGLPFSPPVQTRVVGLPASTKDQRSQMTEGLCHKCNVWVPLLSVKNIDAIVPELIWWKHAKKCHGDTTIQGEGDPYVQDGVYQLILQRKAEHGATG